MLLTVHDLERGDIDGRHHAVGLDLVRQEGVEAAGGAEVDTAVAGLDARVRLELLAHQSVVEGEPLHVTVGHVFDDAPFCREPQGTLLFDDAHDVVVGHVEAGADKAVLALVVAAESAQCADP